LIDDELVNLRLLGTGKGAEIAASVAIKLAGKPYAVIHDHNGNITTLIASETSELFESYRYSAFGE